MARRWICGSGVQPVRVVHGDGQVLSLTPPVKVADILVNHPHHYICHMSPELPSNKSPMLALDYDLEPGYLYFLLPLPRLFPTSSAGPPTCCCQSSNHDTSLEEGHTTPVHSYSSQKFPFSPLRLKSVQHMVDKIGSPIRTAKKKVSPELSRSPAFSAFNISSGTTSQLLSPTYGSPKHSKRGGGILSQINRRSASPRKRSLNRFSEKSNAVECKGSMRETSVKCFMEDLCLKWKPGLGCISETDAIVTARQELRLCLDRRRLTFDSKVRNYSPVRREEHNRSPVRREERSRSAPRERLQMAAKQDEYSHQPAGQHMSLGSYIFAV